MPEKFFNQTQNLMKTLTIVLSCLILASCSQKKKPNENNSEMESNNVISLFDGNTLDGWRNYRSQSGGSWAVADGTIHLPAFDNRQNKDLVDLITTEKYDNFELSLEFKIDNQSNSGIIYLCSEEFDHSYASGPEYQVLDDVGYPGEKIPSRLTSSLYDLYAPDSASVTPVGEWNSVKIIVNNDTIEHWLNGKKVLSCVRGSADWNSRVANSKWKDFSGFGLTKVGHIALQDHGNEVWYRNINIKKLN